jgi:hypothetical protein
MNERASRARIGAASSHELLRHGESDKSDNRAAGMRSYLDAALNANRLGNAHAKAVPSTEFPLQTLRSADLTDWLRAAAQTHEHAWR